MEQGEKERSGLENVLGQVVTNDKAQFGLVELSGPPGVGKSTAVMSFIADQLIDHGSQCRRYVFVTNVKRNLPVGLLLRILEERGRPELAELVANLDSNMGMFLNNLDAARKVMPHEAFEYMKKVGKTADGDIRVAAGTFDIRALPEFKEAEKLVLSLERARALPVSLGEVRAGAIAAAEQSLKKAEFALRKTISKTFDSMCTVDENGYRLLTRSEKRALVSSNAWWQWLAVLYPSVFTYKKRVLFMSVNKMLVKNSPIIEPSESFWESDVLQGAVVFIDEFELSKGVINDAIIDESVSNMADVVNIFRLLMGRTFEGHAIGMGKKGSRPRQVLSSKLLRSSKGDKRKSGDESDKGLETQFELLAKKAEEVYAELHLDKQFRLSDNLQHKNQPFLFNDYQSFTVAADKSTWVAVRFLRSHNEIEFGSGERPYPEGRELQKSDYYPVPLLLARMEGIVRSAVRWVARVAENYVKLVEREAEKGKRAEISFDSAVRTVLSELNLMDEANGAANPTLARIVAMVHEQRAHGMAAAGAASDDPANLCLHQTGFKVYAFAESVQHDTLTRMERCGMPCTAERKLVELCMRNLVVGISASLDIPSVLGNYDLDYVEGVLRDHCIKLNDEQKGLIKHDYLKSIGHYGNVGIRVEQIVDEDETGAYDERLWLAVFDDEALARRTFNEVALGFIAKHGDSVFSWKRVLKVCVAFRRFWETDDARAMLCVLNALPKAGDTSFDLVKLSAILERILASLGVDVDVEESFCVLGGPNDEFERIKADALGRLAAGKKLFVITAYNSAGAGQNLQYVIPEGVRPVKINDRPASGEMDFDCIYLEAPTYTSSVIFDGQKLDEAAALHHILECEYLYENAEISRKSLRGGIANALYALSGRGSDFGHKQSESARMLAAKQIYQAVGRLCRTNMKMPTIRIFADEHLFEGIPLDKLKACGVMFTPEFEALTQAFGLSVVAPSAEIDRLINRASIASDRSRACIYSMLGSGWRDASLNAWRNLGEQVLKFPTLPEGWAEAPYMERNYYVDLGEARPSYSYVASDDFKQVEVLFGQTTSQSAFTVSAHAARLDELMRIPGMRAHFQEHGYATQWEPSARIMTPVVAESIYKGRLGEACGRFILEQCGIAVRDIDDAATFEKFDFFLPDECGGQGAYIDFKHWKKLSDKCGWESQRLLDWVFQKMEAIDARKAIIANILPPDDGTYDITRRSRGGRKLLIVPSLVKNDGAFDGDAIQAVRSFAYGIAD